MTSTSTDYTLMKLDKIEDMLREVKQLLLARADPQPAMAVKGVKLNWAEGRKAGIWVLMTIYRHLPTLGGLVYLKATGQSDKIIAYINGLVGI